MAVVKDQKKIKKSPEVEGSASQLPHPSPAVPTFMSVGSHKSARGRHRPGTQRWRGSVVSESVSWPGRGFINASHSEPDVSRPWDIHLHFLQALLPQPSAPIVGWFSAPEPPLGRRAGHFAGRGDRRKHILLRFRSPSCLPCFVEQLCCELHPSSDSEGNAGIGSRRVTRAEILVRPLDEAAPLQTLGCSGTWGKAPLKDGCGL